MRRDRCASASRRPPPLPIRQVASQLSQAVAGRCVCVAKVHLTRSNPITVIVLNDELMDGRGSPCMPVFSV
ncbi:unnamed protein product [Colias eurytheme]|nr:unnamed protein product [Colias eurytheme]